MDRAPSWPGGRADRARDRRRGSPSKGSPTRRRLARAYDLVYDADFAAAEAELTRACGPAPAEACDVVRAASLWWQHLPRYRQPQPAIRRFIATIDNTIERVRPVECARTRAGGGVVLPWRGVRGARAVSRPARRVPGGRARRQAHQERAREGAVARPASSRTPISGSACTQYYADTAPAVLKFLRWLLLLPGGDKVEGPASRCSRPGTWASLLKSEAAYQLHFDLPVVREEPGRARWRCSRNCAPATRTIRSSC